MSDVGEAMREWAKSRQEKRALNREASAKVLTDAGVQFVSKNDGAHLIVAGAWDFWPGTGKYHSRTTPTSGRGVRNLLRELQR